MKCARIAEFKSSHKMVIHSWRLMVGMDCVVSRAFQSLGSRKFQLSGWSESVFDTIRACSSGLSMVIWKRLSTWHAPMAGRWSLWCRWFLRQPCRLKKQGLWNTRQEGHSNYGIPTPFMTSLKKRHDDWRLLTKLDRMWQASRGFMD